MTKNPLEIAAPATAPVRGPHAPLLPPLFGSYVEAKQRQNVLDYDDLLLYWAQMMQVEEIAREVSSRFDGFCNASRRSRI